MVVVEKSDVGDDDDGVVIENADDRLRQIIIINSRNTFDMLVHLA